MVELVVVMVIIGILAVFAAPRFLDERLFEATGFHDEALALIRYAQKAAIAQHRTTCVEFPDSRTMQVLIFPTTTASACDTNLTGPNGTTPYTVTASANTGHNQVAADTFNFDSLGRPSFAANRAIVITNAGTITIEAVTGYAH